MKTMTIRNIPDGVASFLSGRAASEGRSINATAVSLLAKAAGLEPSQKKRRDLSWLTGSWSDAFAESFDAAVADCRTVRPEDWK
ncbi:MAG: hypothetical protein IKO55_18810 [Kiritimatiellae bacterium]|nr:hypothetical protein [Kiritimatiellia bacterium]